MSGVVVACAVVLGLFLPRYRNPVRFDFVENRRDVGGDVYGPESDAEGDFLWGGDGPIDVRFSLRNILLPEDLRIVFYFKMRPYTCVGLPEQALDVFANDGHVARVALKPRWSVYRIEVPTSELRVGTNRFTLAPAFAASPRSCGEDDDRRLSIAYDHFVIDGATAFRAAPAASREPAHASGEPGRAGS